MANLIRKGTREVVEVAPGDVQRYLSSGEFNIPSDLVSDGRVEMISDNGDVTKVDLKDMHEAFRHGYNLESGESRQVRAMEKEYSGFLPGLTSGTLGAAKGLTFGLSSAILNKLGVDVEAYETLRPDEFTVGDVAGTTIGILGGAGIGGLAVRGGAKLAAKGAAKATANMAEKTFGQKLMKKAAEGAIEGTIDGALYGAGEAVHEIGIGRAELTGQLVASHMGGGAAMGLGIGAGLGFAGLPLVTGIGAAAPAVKAAGKAIGKALPITIPNRVTGVQDFFNQIARESGKESLGPMLKDHRLIKKQWNEEQEKAALDWLTNTKVAQDGGELSNIIGPGESWEEIAEKLYTKRGEVGQKLGDFIERVDDLSKDRSGISANDIINRLEKLRSNRDVIPVGSSKALKNAAEEAITNTKIVALVNHIERGLKLDLKHGTNRAMERIEEFARLADTDLDEIIAKVKRHKDVSASPPGDLGLDIDMRRRGAAQEIAETEEAVSRLGPDLDDALGINHGLTPKEDLVADMVTHLIHSAPAKEINAIFDGVKNLEKISIMQGHLAKQNAWKKSRFDKLGASELPDYAKRVGAVWRDAVDDASEEIITSWKKLGQMGEDVIGDLDIDVYKQLKKEYGYASTFHAISNDRALRAAANSQTGMSGLLMASTGALVGGLGAGPWGGAIGATVGAVTTKYLKENGISLTHAGARYLSKLASVRNGKVDDILKRSSEFVKGTGKRRKEVLPLSVKTLSSISFTGAPPEGKTEDEVLSSLADQLESVAADPQMFATMIESQVQDLRVVAPLVAEQTVKSRVEGMKLLSEKIPKSSGSYSSYQPMLYNEMSTMPEPGKTQFKRYLTATMDFAGTLFDDLSAGAVTAETIEVGERVYPEILNEVRTVMAVDLAKDDRPKDNTFMSQMKTVYGEEVIAYQGQDFLRRQQLQYKVESKGSMAGVKPSSAAQGPVAINSETAMDAVQYNLKKV
jgi:hypothetical protein